MKVIRNYAVLWMIATFTAGAWIGSAVTAANRDDRESALDRINPPRPERQVFLGDRVMILAVPGLGLQRNYEGLVGDNGYLELVTRQQVRLSLPIDCPPEKIAFRDGNHLYLAHDVQSCGGAGLKIGSVEEVFPRERENDVPAVLRRLSDPAAEED